MTRPLFISPKIFLELIAILTSFAAYCTHRDTCSRENSPHGPDFHEYRGRIGGLWRFPKQKANEKLRTVHFALWLVGEVGRGVKFVLGLKKRWKRLDRLQKLLLCGFMGGTSLFLGWLVRYVLAGYIWGTGVWANCWLCTLDKGFTPICDEFDEWSLSRVCPDMLRKDQKSRDE
jgi:hypothetical protein